MSANIAWACARATAGLRSGLFTMRRLGMLVSLYCCFSAVLAISVFGATTNTAFAAADTCRADGGTAMCRAAEPTSPYIYGISTSFGINPTPPFQFQSDGEAIAHRKHDYLTILTTLCTADPNEQAWGSPSFFMGVETISTAPVLWHMTGYLNAGNPCGNPITALDVVGRSRTVSCDSYKPNDVTAPLNTWCYLLATSPDFRKNLGPCPACNTPNPINVALGNKHQEERDYAGSGPFPLTLTRYYNSYPSASSPSVGLVMPARFGLASGWRHTYDRSVVLAVSTRFTTAFVHRPDGKVYGFTLSNGGYVGDADVNDRLQQLLDAGGQPAGWRYTVSPGDEVETYDVNGVLQSIANRAGLTQTLAYDTLGRLSSVTDPAGRQLVFAYDAIGRIATITDPAGKIFTYAYATLADFVSSNLTSVTDPEDNVRTYLYNEPGFGPGIVTHSLTGIQDENGQRYGSYTYNASGLAVGAVNGTSANSFSLSFSGTNTTVTDPLGVTRTHSFQNVQGVPRSTALTQACTWCGSANFQSQTPDANGNVASSIDFNGNRTNYTYDLTRNLETQRVEGLTSGGAPTTATRTISTQWHATFRLPALIAEPKRITSYTYDAQGNLTSKSIQATTDASGALGFGATPTGSPRTWTYTNTYSGTIPGLLVQQVVDGPRTDVSDLTTYVWDNAGNLQSVTDALGHVTGLSDYDAHGRPQTITDPNGLITTLTYDLRGRLTSKTVGGELTSYTYDGVGQLTQVTLPDGSFLTYGYDTAHRLTQIEDSLNNKIVYTLDGMGNRTQEQVFDPSNTLAQTRSRVYNSLNRLIQDIGGANPATEITAYAYDNQGNLTSVTDPLSHATINAYDALNRLAMVTDPGSGITRYGYDGLDQMASVADPRNLTTSYTQDGLGNLSQTQSPDAGPSGATFDAAGNAITRIDAKAQISTYQYDALNRLAQISWADGKVWTYGYDAGGNGLGRLTSISDPTGTTTFAYDQHGRLTQKQQTLLSYSSTYPGVTLTTGYGYNSAGQLVSQTYPSGHVVSYTYTNGLITQVKLDGSPIASNIVYWPFGQPRSWTFGNGKAVTRSFDLDGRMTSNPVGSIVYDAASRITQAYGGTYGYDALDRLTSYSLPPYTSESYSYDANGNRVSQTLGSTTRTYSISPSSNRIVSSTSGGSTRSYSYDANGSITGNGVLTLAYDATGTLKTAQGNAEYTNALHQRTLTSLYGFMPRWYAYDERGHLTGSYAFDVTGYFETVFLGDMPIAAVDGYYGVNYIDTDHLGSPRIVTNASQQAVWTWNPGTFGVPSPNMDPGNTGNFYNYYGRFPGQYYSDESSLHYNYFRDYDPSAGRYVESDPIGLEGLLREDQAASYRPRVSPRFSAPNPVLTAQTIVNGQNSQKLHLYAYVGGNPISRGDPTGQGWGTAVLFVVAAGAFIAYEYFHDALPKCQEQGRKLCVNLRLQAGCDACRKVQEEYERKCVREWWHIDEIGP